MNAEILDLTILVEEITTMKRKLSLVAIFYISLTLFIAVACESVDDCGGPYPNRYKVESMFAVFSSYSINGDRYSFQPVDTDTMSADELALSLYFGTTTYFAERSSVWSGLFVNTAMACTPVPPTSEEVVTGISVYSDNDFGSEFPAGSDISALFDVVVDGFAYSVDEFIGSEPNAVQTIRLVLKIQPENESLHQFDVIYQQDGLDVSELAFELSPIHID